MELTIRYPNVNVIRRLGKTLERVGTAWDVLRGGPVAAPPDAWKAQAPFLWPLFRRGTPQWHLVDFQSYAEEGFTVSSLIYSAVMYKVRSLAAAPLRAYRGPLDRPEPVEASHPLAQLVARPNRHQSWGEFAGQSEVYLNIAGDCYSWLQRPSRGGFPEAIYSLRPDRTYIVPDEKPRPQMGIKGYVYVPEGKTLAEGVPLLPQDVMHVKFPNPLDPLEGMGYGLSPVSALAQSGDVDNAVTRFLDIFFEKGTMLGSLLSFEQDMNADDIAEVRERWMEIYGGSEKWHVPGVLGRGGRYERIGMTFEEMGFQQIDQRNEARILGPFGVPGVLIGSRLGLERAIRANAQELRRMFWEDTMIPEMRLFEVEYQYYLQTDDGAWVRHDVSGVPALQKNVPELATAAFQLWQMGVPANQALEAVGLDVGNVPGGETGYVGMMLMPSGTRRPESEGATGGSATPPTPEAEEEAEEQARRLPAPERPHIRLLTGKKKDAVLAREPSSSLAEAVT